MILVTAGMPDIVFFFLQHCSLFSFAQIENKSAMGNLLTTRLESIDRLDEAEQLRSEALVLQKQAKEFSEKSQHEYQHGSRSEAKNLSNEKNPSL